MILPLLYLNNRRYVAHRPYPEMQGPDHFVWLRGYRTCTLFSDEKNLFLTIEANMAFTLRTYLNIVRASALYDLLATAPFASPWSFQWDREHLSLLNVGLGGTPLPTFAPFHVLIACLLGSIVVVWSILRLVSPEVRLGRFDATARILFAVWMSWAIAQTGAPILWLFLIPEITWSFLQWWPIKDDKPGTTDDEAASRLVKSCAM